MTDVTIVMSGPFRVLGADGADLTPRSAKAQGLLLLLLLSRDGLRGRRTLQDHLWSDRGQEQGANSLRQALSQIRAALGPRKDLLAADRRNVSLDLSRIALDAEAEGDLAEGLDVRDPVFEHWLTRERQGAEDARASRAEAERRAAEVEAARAIRDEAAGLQEGAGLQEAAAPSPAQTPPDPAPPPARRLFIEMDLDAAGGADWAAWDFADEALRLLGEQHQAGPIIGTPEAAAAHDLRLRLSSRRDAENRLGLRADLEEHLDRGAVRRVWWRFQTLAPGEGDRLAHPAAQRLGAEIAEAFHDKLLADGAGPVGVDLLCARGVRHVFAMSKEDLLQADLCFAAAQKLQSRGLHLAWRAQVRAVQRVERHDLDLARLREEGRAFAERALELDPRNSMTLALCANAFHILLQDPGRGLELAERAVAITPGNPMARWAFSSANLYAGRYEDSYREARHGRYLTARSPYRYWWDLQLFIAAMMTGREAEAAEWMEKCAAGNRRFRPPLRYLVVLRANAGDEERAQEAIGGLRKLEPEFSVDMMLGDPDYPASLLHRATLFDLQRVAAAIR